jgi:hypothetical protein
MGAYNSVSLSQQDEVSFDPITAIREAQLEVATSQFALAKYENSCGWPWFDCWKSKKQIRAERRLRFAKKDLARLHKRYQNRM